MSGISELVELYRQDESLVDIFGLILFTDEHANIKKVINDEDYWSAFNKLSGKRWVIFSSKQKNGSDGYPPSRPGISQFMVPIWKEPEENKALLNYLELKNSKELPLIRRFYPRFSDTFCVGNDDQNQ